MRKVVYSMTMSLDGFIAGPAGEIDWSAPDEELHRFHNDRVRDVGVQLCGRRLYEVMLFWETVDQDPSASEILLEFAGIWEAIPKIVFSSTLESVDGNARLAREDIVGELTALQAQAGGDIAVGGAGLAARLVELDLIDEYQIFVSPVILGAGIPFFPALAARIKLELIETRVFGSQVVYLRYRRVRSASA